MSILEHDVRSADNHLTLGLRRHTVTRAEYYAMSDASGPNSRRIELIEGEIIEMLPIGPWHASVPDPIHDVLRGAFEKDVSIRIQMPISLGDDVAPSEPQPDIVVARGSWRDYTERHPYGPDVLLVIEVSDSTLAYDRDVKGRLYATAAIPEYWIVNAPDRQLEVYRDPAANGYRSSTILRSGDVVSPICATGTPIALADFLS